MKKNFVKKLALGLAMVMAVSSVNVPAASAATAPFFKTTSVTVEEGATVKAVIKKTKGWTIKKVVSKNESVATIKKVAQKAKKTNVKITGVKAGEAVVKAVLKKNGVKVKAKLAVTVKAAKAEVKAAVATASRTVTLTGTNLDKLTQADVTVAGYNVIDFKATKTTATITLDRMMVPNAAIDVTAGEFTGSVQYNLTVNSLEVVAGTFDDDLAYQYVKFTVNGEAIEAQDMLDNGYTVMFSAIDLNLATPANCTTTFFADPMLGEIAVPAKEGLYSVNVTVSNGTTVVASEYATIVIDDLHASVNSIDSYVLMNDNATMVLPQNSTTFVVGETADFASIKATVDGIAGNQVVGAATIKTSNPEIISVNPTTKELKAETVGNATITISYGNVTKTINFTVTNVARKLNTAKVYDTNTYTYVSSKNYVSSTNTSTTDTLKVVPFDQYGDPIQVTDIYAGSSNTAVAYGDPVNFTEWSGAISDGDNDGYYDVTLTIPASANGRASIIIRDKVSLNITQQTNTKTLLTFAYNVSNNDTVTYKKLESANGKYNVAVTSTAINVVLKGYNSANVFVNYLAMDGYTLTTTNSDVIAVGSATGTTYPCTGTTAPIYAVGAGTATVTLTNDTTGVKTSVVFTVTNTVPVITGVTFKAANTVVVQNKTFTFRDFLTTTETSGNGYTTDLIVSGISTNVNTTSKIRVSSIDGINGVLYLDRNDDGIYGPAVAGTDAELKPADMYLGTITLSTTVGSSASLDDLTTDAGSQGYVKAVVTTATGVVATTTIKVAVPFVY